MRILFLSNFYPPHELGGYAQLCQEVADRLRDRGHALHVLTSRHRRPGTNGAEERHVSRELFLESEIDYYRPLDFFTRRAARGRANRRALERVIERHDPDIVVVWGMWNLSLELPAWLESRLAGRVVYYIASYWPTDEDPHSRYWRLPANRLLTEGIKRPLRVAALASLAREGYPPPLRLDHAYCCSAYVRDTLVTAGAIPPEARVLYTGIDTTPFDAVAASRTPSAGNLRLLYFGRLIEDKGVHTALEALARLEREGAAGGMTLTLLGGGHPDYVRRLREMIARDGLADRVRFVPQIPRDQVPALLADHDIYLFTSIWPEPLARSVMEAMAAGLLVIGSEVGGQPEMMRDGENALTFPPGDAASLAQRLARVADEPALVADLARAGRATVRERFRIERMIDEVERELVSIAGDA